MATTSSRPGAADLAGIAGWQLWQRYEARQRDKVSDGLRRRPAHHQSPRPPPAPSPISPRPRPRAMPRWRGWPKPTPCWRRASSDSAVALYKEIADDDNGAVGAVARLRAAWALADTASRADLADLLAAAGPAGSAWRRWREEMLAYADYRAIRHQGGAGEFNALADDPERRTHCARAPTPWRRFLEQWRRQGSTAPCRRPCRRRRLAPRPRLPPPRRSGHAMIEVSRSDFGCALAGHACCWPAAASARMLGDTVGELVRAPARNPICAASAFR